MMLLMVVDTGWDHDHSEEYTTTPFSTDAWKQTMGLEKSRTKNENL
jgi:hypothetical protein